MKIKGKLNSFPGILLLTAILVLITAGCGKSTERSVEPAPTTEEIKQEAPKTVQPDPAVEKKQMEAIKIFVQNFYDWYTPIAVRAGNPRRSGKIALEEKRDLFSPELAQALQDDYDAQAGATGKIAGIDWDPFLNNQNPCGTCKVGDVTKKDNRWYADVYWVCSDRAKSDKPNIVAEVGKKGDSWEFRDFQGPANNYDLMISLKLLKAERESEDKKDELSRTSGSE